METIFIIARQLSEGRATTVLCIIAEKEEGKLPLMIGCKEKLELNEA